MEYIGKPFYHFDAEEDLAILAMLDRQYQTQSGGGETMFNLFLNYTTTTNVANTVVETSLLGAGDRGTTKTVAPALTAVGRTFELYFAGVLGWTLAPGLTIRLKLGGALGTTIVTLTPPLAGSNPGAAWRMSLFATITAIGAGGSILAEPSMFEFTLGAADGATQWSGRGANGFAINFSVNQDWALTAQWAVADPANFLTYSFGIINVI